MNDFLNQMRLVGDWLTSSAQWHGDDSIPRRLLEHLTYSGLSLLFAALVGLTFGLLVGHTGRGAFAVATVANLARGFEPWREAAEQLVARNLAGAEAAVFGGNAAQLYLSKVATAPP